jgi:hypothetical protein
MGWVSSQVTQEANEDIRTVGADKCNEYNEKLKNSTGQ